MATKKNEGRKRRKLRIRKKVHGDASRPRLSVFRSARHIYAQVIDDTSGQTLVCASTMGKAYREEGAEAEAGKGNKSAEARRVGTQLAKVCKTKGIERVVFDRNGYLYHGRVKALADAARKAGLDF